MKKEQKQYYLQIRTEQRNDVGVANIAYYFLIIAFTIFLSCLNPSKVNFDMPQQTSLSSFVKRLFKSNVFVFN